jgi:hypothetical protein
LTSASIVLSWRSLPMITNPEKCPEAMMRRLIDQLRLLVEKKLIFPESDIPRKSDPNHKATFYYGVACSCGWSSASWYGQGAKHRAASEWHLHRDKCEKATNERSS